MNKNDQKLYELKVFLQNSIIKVQQSIMVNLRETTQRQDEIIKKQNEIIEMLKGTIYIKSQTVEPSIKTVVRRAKKSLENVMMCAYCGGQGNEHIGPDNRFWHIDHIEPKSLGGTNDPTNLVKSCATCNIRKGTKLVPPMVGTITAAGSIAYCAK